MERERKLCESESGHGNDADGESCHKKFPKSPKTQRLLEKIINDPIYKSALELSHDSSKQDLCDSLVSVKFTNENSINSKFFFYLVCTSFRKSNTSTWRISIRQC